MLSFITSLLPTSYFLPGWLTLDTNPLDSLLQGEHRVHSVSRLSELLQAVFKLHRWLECVLVMQNQCYVTRRTDRCMWDLCAMLLVESALIFRGREVRKLHFNRPLHEEEFGVKLYNLTGLQDFKFSPFLSKYSHFSADSNCLHFPFISHLSFPPQPTAGVIKMIKTHQARGDPVIKGELKLDLLGCSSFSLWLGFWL